MSPPGQSEALERGSPKRLNINQRLFIRNSPYKIGEKYQYQLPILRVIELKKKRFVLK